MSELTSKIQVILYLGGIASDPPTLLAYLDTNIHFIVEASYPLSQCWLETACP